MFYRSSLDKGKIVCTNAGIVSLLVRGCGEAVNCGLHADGGVYTLRATIAAEELILAHEGGSVNLSRTAHYEKRCECCTSCPQFVRASAGTQRAAKRARLGAPNRGSRRQNK